MCRFVCVCVACSGGMPGNVQRTPPPPRHRLLVTIMWHVICRNLTPVLQSHKHTHTHMNTHTPRLNGERVGERAGGRAVNQKAQPCPLLPCLFVCVCLLVCLAVRLEQTQMQRWCIHRQSVKLDSEASILVVNCSTRAREHLELVHTVLRLHYEMVRQYSAKISPSWTTAVNQMRLPDRG